MKKNIFKLLKFFLFFVVFLSSCKTEKECDTSTESLVKINFYVMTESLDSAVIVKPISAYGVGHKDSLLYENDSISFVLLPLSPNGETTEFAFEIGPYTENILFTYKTTTYFESKECGFIANYEIESVSYSTNIIDTLIIINNEVTVENEDHVKLFFVNNNLK
ncbi:MAG: DUF6452 family protein [Bacteroidota bacterium]